MCIRHGLVNRKDTKMDITVNAKFDEYSGLKEIDRNTLATEYMSDNYKRLLRFIECELRVIYPEDLFQDVYISLLKRERVGRGFNQQYGDGTITVGQFVYGIIKKMSNNKKYQKPCEVIKGSGAVATASYSEGDDFDDLDSFQKAFAAAKVYDNTAEVDMNVSIRDELEYCINVCNYYDIQIVNLLRNMDRLADCGKKALEAVTEKIRVVIAKDKELGETLNTVLAYSARNRAEMLELLDEFGGQDGTRLLATC